MFKSSWLFIPALRVRPRWLSLPMSGELTERESFFTVCLISSSLVFLMTSLGHNTWYLRSSWAAENEWASSKTHFDLWLSNYSSFIHQMNMIWIGFSCTVAVVRSVSVSVLSNRKQPPKWLCGLEKKYQPQPQSLVGSFPAWLRQWLVPSFLTPCWFMSSSTLRSPMSCLPLLFDQRDGLGAGVRVRPENVPPASSHIELLLEKHGSGEMGVNSEWDWKKRYTPVVPRGFQSTTWLKGIENIVNIHFFHFLRPLNETVREVEVTGWTTITLTERSGVVFILRTHKLKGLGTTAVPSNKKTNL